METTSFISIPPDPKSRQMGINVGGLNGGCAYRTSLLYIKMTILEKGDFYLRFDL